MSTFQKTVFWLSLLTLASGWLIVILFDILNLFALGEVVIEYSVREASFFVIIFSEARPIEWAQWFCLMTACISSAYVSADRSSKQSERGFFLLFSVLFGLMLIEDAGNLRHQMIGIYDSISPNGGIRNLITIVYYFALSLLPLYAIFVYGLDTIENKRTWYIFFAGLLFYALASFSSATGFLWYGTAGEILNSNLFGGRVVFELADTGPPGVWIMDFLIEETLELLGALAFVLFFIKYN